MSAKIASDTLLKRVEKMQYTFVLFVFFVVQLLLTGCMSHLGDMKAADMRAAIDNCRQNHLGVLAYQRADRSIMAIRCIPLPSEVNHSVTIRKRINMPLFRIITENIDIQED